MPPGHSLDADMSGEWVLFLVGARDLYMMKLASEIDESASDGAINGMVSRPMVMARSTL